LKTNEPILLQIGAAVNGARWWNDNFWGKAVKGQSHTAPNEVTFGGLVDASLSTPK